MVVVTTVVEVPVPRVYVKTTLSDPLLEPVAWGPELETPVPRGTVEAAPRALDAELPALTPVPRGAEDEVVDATPRAVLEAAAADE